MGGKGKELILNWVPVAFSSNVLEIPFRNEEENKIDQHKLYEDVITFNESGDKEKISGNFLFNDNSLSKNHEILLVEIDNLNNCNLINEFITQSIIKGLSERGFLTKKRFGGRFSIIDPNSKEEIIPEVSVFDEFIFKPHYVYSSKDKKVSYGLIINHKNNYRIDVDVKDLSIFINSLVLAIDKKETIKGILKSLNDHKGTIQIRKRIGKNKFEYSSKEFDIDKISPIGSMTNFYRLLKSKYLDDFEKINNKRKRIVGIFTSNNEVNINRLNDKHNKIKGFLDEFKEEAYFKLFNYSDVNFKIQDNYLEISQSGNGKISIYGSRLEKRKFIFSDNKSTPHLGQYQGLRNNGPYKEITDPEGINYLFIYPKEQNNLANSLYFALKNGLGPFPGIESFFKMKIDRENLKKVEVDTNVNDLRSLTTNYYKSVESFLELNEDLQSNKTIAFIIFSETRPNEFPNPYHAVKALLIKHGITSQAVNIETIESASFKWSIGNIALAIFSKLGGIPWRVESNTSAKQLIFGIGRKYIYNENDNSLEKIVGFTLCVTSEGEFKSVSTFNPFESEKSYLENLSTQVESSIEKILSNSENIDEVIVHFPKRSSYSERESIKSALKNLSKREGLLYPFATVRITEGDPYLIWDKGHRTFLPEEGNYAIIKPKDALLVIPGRQEKQSLATVPKSPLRISLESSNLPSTQFDQILYQTYALAGANWRGFNAREMPITIFYSELIAEIIGHMAKYEVEFYEGLEKLENTPWFL